jgi:prepilin-type N-terminal cleavage/methylation domain-containing protein
MRTPCKPRHSAFSLLELLLVITVLGIIISLTAVILGSGRRTGDNMLREEDVLRSGRTALDNLADDLNHAVADPAIRFLLRDDRNGAGFCGAGFSELNMVVWNADATGSNRSTRAVQYWVETDAGSSNSCGRLMRACRAMNDPDNQAAADNWYWQNGWVDDRPTSPEETALVANSVTAFTVGAPDTQDAVRPDYDSIASSNRLPAYVDIYLELLDENAARRAETVSDPATIVDRDAVRFALRVAPGNRFAEDSR